MLAREPRGVFIISHQPTILFLAYTNTSLPPTVMSQANPTATSSSNFQPIFNNALKEYQRRTKKDLLTHPLAAQLQACDSPSSILVLLRQQVQELDRSQRAMTD